MKKIFSALAVLFFSAVLFADIGPAPASPEVTVSFTRAGAPVSYTEIEYSYYSCSVTPDDGDIYYGSMSQRVVNMTHSGGVFMPLGWFYKFNPCFYGGNATVVYKLAGEQSHRVSQVFFVSDGSNTVFIDVSSGTAENVSVKPPSPPDNFVCIPGIGVVLLLGFFASLRR